MYLLTQTIINEESLYYILKVNYDFEILDSIEITYSEIGDSDTLGSIDYINNFLYLSGLDISTFKYSLSSNTVNETIYYNSNKVIELPNNQIALVSQEGTIIIYDLLSSTVFESYNLNISL
jgi:hypothetical protein